MRLSRPTVGNGVRQITIRRSTTKHRLNKRTVAIDVSHHHDDIARSECRIFFQHRQQSIVQDFNFALRAMANMEGDAVILRIELPFVIAAGKLFKVHAYDGAVFQFQNVGLNVMQQAVWSNIDKGIQFLTALEISKQIDVVSPQLAP